MTQTIAESYPELFHYTGPSGLEGILKSQTLWATHAAFLNDSTEIRAFETRLLEILRPAVAEGIADLVRKAPANVELVAAQGGEAATINEVVAGISRGTFAALLGGQDRSAFIDPYVTSFCTAGSPEIAQHGLLSQWRGYGRAGGYALVFDTERLSSLLDQEGEKWRHDLFGGDVIYSSDPPEKLLAEFDPNIALLKSSIADWLKTAGAPDALEPVFHALIRCACRYKHWGFHEEKEVRIIAIPPNAVALQQLKMRGHTIPKKPQHHFLRGGTPVPCIYLFEGITALPDNPLPLRRIIVGPHPAQAKRRRAVELLLEECGVDVPISTSEIPYVENFYGF